MKDSNGEVIRAGYTITSSYGIPPKGINGQVVRQMYGGQIRLMVLTPGHDPDKCLLGDFMRHMNGDVEIIARNYRQQNEK